MNMYTPSLLEDGNLVGLTCEAGHCRTHFHGLKPSLMSLMAAVSWAALSHCGYHQHSERFIVAVTAGPRQRKIVVWDRWSGHVHLVGLYSARRDRMGFLHNELHPTWAPDGCTLAFDSTHTGQGWQVTAPAPCVEAFRANIHFEHANRRPQS